MPFKKLELTPENAKRKAELTALFDREYAHLKGNERRLARINFLNREVYLPLRKTGKIPALAPSLAKSLGNDIAARFAAKVERGADAAKLWAVLGSILE